jgi:hypothetical protein
VSKGAPLFIALEERLPQHAPLLVITRKEEPEILHTRAYHHVVKIHKKQGIVTVEQVSEMTVPVQPLDWHTGEKALTALTDLLDHLNKLPLKVSRNGIH